MKTKKDLETTIVDLTHRIEDLININVTLNAALHNKTTEALHIKDNTNENVFNEQYNKFVDMNNTISLLI